jgi:hypothetical protein
VIGTDVQNTTLPNKGPAKAAPESVKREMLKRMVAERIKRSGG